MPIPNQTMRPHELFGLCSRQLHARSRPADKEHHSRAHVGEPAKHLAGGTSAGTQIRQAGERDTEEARSCRETPRRRLGEPARGVALERETVESSGRGVQVGGRGGPCRRQDRGVDDGWEGLPTWEKRSGQDREGRVSSSESFTHIDSRIADRDDERRGGSGSRA